MDILFLTPYLPSPPRSGGPRRIHGLMSGLARSHSVSVLSLAQPGGDLEEEIRATEEYCAEVVAIPSERCRLGALEKRALQLRSLVSRFSYERAIYHSAAIQRALDDMVQRNKYDIINVEFSLMACYRFPSAVPVVLDEHNIEYDILYRTYAVERQPVRKMYNFVNYRKLRREEQDAWRGVDGCTLTSSRDEAVLNRECPMLPTAVVPNAVDTVDFHVTTAPSVPLTILFFGAIDYYPNTDGLLFFLREVLPLLRPRYPGLKLYIVGPSPPDTILQWAGDDVIITGFVEDLRVYLSLASVIIAPLRIGGGTRLKIVEAMAMGKPVVSTTIGAEGIDVTDDRDILLGDDARTFAAQVARLLDDEGLGRRLGRAARELVETKYDWQMAVRKLEAFYGELAAGRSERVRREGASVAHGAGRHHAVP